MSEKSKVEQLKEKLCYTTKAACEVLSVEEPAQADG